MSEKKKNAIIIVLAIVAVVTLCAGVLKTNKSKELVENDFKSLISTQYDITEFSSDKNKISLIVSGDLQRDDIEELSKEIYYISKENRIKQKKIDIELLENNTESKNEFYFEGLKNKARIDIGSRDLELISFEKVVAEKGESLREYSGQKIVSSERNNLNIDIKIDLENLSDEEVLTQLKTYTDLFIRTNEDKKIETIKVNANSGIISYEYSSKYNDILSKIERLTID